MVEYNAIKIDGDFNQTDKALSQVIQNNECTIIVIVVIFVLAAIFFCAIVKIFKITNYKSIENHSCRKRRR